MMLDCLSSGRHVAGRVGAPTKTAGVGEDERGGGAGVQGAQPKGRGEQPAA